MGSATGLTPPQLRSDMSMTSGLTEGAGMPESRLKIYSDLFEEVIERDRVFGSLLRKIKTAYDMLLLRSPAVPPFPMDASSMAHRADMDHHSWTGGQDTRGPGSLHSNEPTTRAEGGQGWEMQRENRVLKDLVERLHLELEEAVRREHRWKQKVTKLKSRADDKSDSRPTPPPQGQFHGKVIEEFYSQGHSGHPSKDFYAQVPSEKDFYSQAHGDYHSQGGHMRPEDLAAAEAQKFNGVPSFHASRREPGLGENSEGGQEGPLNQGGLLSLSSISPTAGALSPPPPESFAVESARSADSGQLPQRPRLEMFKPSNVPCLDFSKLKDQLEDDEDEEEFEGEGQEEEGFEDEDLDEQDMQAHGKINRDRDDQQGSSNYDECEDEDACWPSFERCSIRDAGHICHPPAKAAAGLRPQNPMGYDDEDSHSDHSLPDGPEGLSRHSH